MSMKSMLAAEAKIEPVKTGLDAKARQKISSQLVAVLADTYTLLVKTHVYHWNVVGPLFLPLHQLTEQHYQDLFEATDVIAERIRALGHTTPVSFDQMLPKADVVEERGTQSAGAMIKQLIADHEKITQKLREVALNADDVDDLVTADMLTARLTVHEKAIWMLRAIDS